MDFHHPITRAERATDAEVRAVRVITEQLHRMTAEKACRAAYALLCDHPGMTSALLDDLSNTLGRAAGQDQ